VTPRWLTADEISEINRALMGRTGEPHAVRDRPGLEGAAARPINHWVYGEQSVARLAAYLLLGVAHDHPFIQGNKRTALIAADGFLKLNGHRLLYPDADLADLILERLEGRISEDEFVAAFADGVGEVRRARASDKRYLLRDQDGRFRTK
jgi:death-on-curing protein